MADLVAVVSKEFDDGDDRPVRHPCDDCDDGDGGCAYPWYGMAPGVCATAEALGSPVERGLFIPDGPEGICGTYARCPTCGHGLTDDELAQIVTISKGEST